MTRQEMIPPCFSSSGLGIGDDTPDKQVRAEGIVQQILKIINVNSTASPIMNDVAGKGGANARVLALRSNYYRIKLPSARTVEKVKKRFGLKEDPKWYPDRGLSFWSSYMLS